MKTLARYLIPRLFLPLILSVPTVASAQATAALSPGDRIRVRWDDGSWSPYSLAPLRSATLDLVFLDETLLVGRRGERLVLINAQSIRSMQRRIGTRPASAPAMVIGSGAGFAAAFLAGAFKAAVDPSVNDTGGVVNAGLSAGVLIGAPLGALVAWLNALSHPIYEDIGIAHLTPGVAMEPSGAVGVSLAISTR